MISYTTYLSHHGIRGQKWHVRRYRNYDGSLTNAGRQRYGGKRTDSDRRASLDKTYSGRRQAKSTETESKARGASNASSKLFDKTIKVGKDKAPISPAEKISKDTKTGLEGVGDIVGGVQTIKSTRAKSSNPMKSMTDEELKSNIERLTLEKRYKDLVAATSETDKGMAYTQSILNIVGGVVGITGSAVGIAATIYGLRHR